MRFTLPQIRRFALILSFLILSFTTGWFTHDKLLRMGKLPVSSDQSSVDRMLPADKSNIAFSLFWQVWDKVQNDYYDKSKINNNQMVLGAIKGMVASLGDPYTVFLPPEEQKRTQEDLDGQFQGVGIEIGFKGTNLAIISPLEGSPAEKAGIKAGDFIVGIKPSEGSPKAGTVVGTVGMSLVDAVNMIRGPAGTKVTLIVTREGQSSPIEAEITRAKIDVPSVVLKFVGDNQSIADIQLKRFGGNTQGEWDQAIMQIQARNPKGIILDLRNNPGGYLTGAVDISSDFIAKGTAVIQEDGNRQRKEFSVNGRTRVATIPMVVLVNGGSASASEIVAGALKDHGRAKIVGVKTFGKGTIQEARPVAGDAGLHITIAKWLTPNGTWVHEKGLEPDVTVEDDVKTQDVDEQLQKAIELL